MRTSVSSRACGPRAVAVFEFEAYPEPKVLTPSDLRALYSRYKSFNRVAEMIGASEAFARQNAAKERVDHMSQMWDIKGAKAVRFHPRVRTVIQEFPEEVRRELGKAIFDLQKGAKLGMPLSRAMAREGLGRGATVEGSKWRLPDILPGEARRRSFNFSRVYEEDRENAEK